MAELKNTVVNGSLAATKIYEGGTALEKKYAGGIALSGSTIQLKDATGTVLSSVTLPAATHTHAGGGLSKGTASGGGLSGGGLSKGTASGGGLSGGGLSITTNYTGTPTINIEKGREDYSTIKGASVSEDKPDSGYYVEVKASSAAFSGKTKATRAAVTRAKFTQPVTRAAVTRAKFSQTVSKAAVTCTETAGWVSAGSHTCSSASSTTVELAADSTTIGSTSTTVELAADSTTIGAASVEPTVTINEASDTDYVVIPTGSHNVTVTNSVTAPKVAVSGTASSSIATSSSATNYYVTVTGTPTNGSVTSNATCTATAGYIPAGTDTASDTDAIAPTVTGSGSKVYIQAGSHDVSVGVTNAITAPKVAVSGAATGFTASSSATSYYVTVSGTPTNGSVTSTANATCTATAGYIAAGTDTASGTDTDAIAPTVTGSGGKVYIPAGGCTKNNFTIETTNNSGISIVHTAGYVPASTNYIKTITVPSGKTLSLITNTGTITTLNSSGTIGTLGGSVKITTFSSTGTIGTKSSTSTITTHSGSTTVTSNTGTLTVTTNNGTTNITTNAASKTVTIGTNNGTVNITSNKSVVNYNNTWKINHDSDGNLEFTLI